MLLCSALLAPSRKRGELSWSVSRLVSLKNCVRRPNLDTIRDSSVEASFAPEKVISIRTPDWARLFEARANKASSHKMLSVN
jgi:hypothetical protein